MSTAAQAKLDAAVEEFVQENGWSRPGLVTTGWVMVVHQQGFDETGEPSGALRKRRNSQCRIHLR